MYALDQEDKRALEKNIKKNMRTLKNFKDISSAMDNGNEYDHKG